MDPQSTDANPQVLYSWKAPLRAYKKRGKNILRFYLALALLLSILVYFFGDKILLIPIWSLLFLFYVLTITPPPTVDNKITKFGIETAGIMLRWEVLSHFHFSKRFNYDILTVISNGPYYFHSYMVVPDEDTKQNVVRLLSEHMIYQERPDRSFTDRMIDWLSQLIPDDDDTNKKEQKKPVEEIISERSSSFGQTQIPASLLRRISDPNE